MRRLLSSFVPSRLSLRSPALWIGVLVAVLIGVGAWMWLDDSGRSKAPIVLWECDTCAREISAPIPLGVGNQTVIDCPTCKTLTARRKLHMRCLDCGHTFIYRPRPDAPRATPTWGCPACKKLNTRPVSAGDLGR